MPTDKPVDPHRLADELDNFQEIGRYLNPSPGELPRLSGIDIAALSMPLHRRMIGGDHLIYVDFKQRYDLEGRAEQARKLGRIDVADRLDKLQNRAGLVLADVSGHRMTDAFIGAMLHQALLVGVNYELELFGEVTTKLFEHLNTRFYKTTAVNKYFTMIYGEISHRGRFRFISAGHHPPAIYSREYKRLMPVHTDQFVSFPPVGLLPSGTDEKREPSFAGYKPEYQINELSLLSVGDVLILFTDGLPDHDDGGFYPGGLEEVLRDAGDATAAEICERLRDAVLARAPQEDDLTVLVIRRVQPA